MTAELSRRLLLRAALAAGGVGLAAPLLAACSSARPRPPGALPAQTQAAPVASPRPNAAVAGERHLLAAYTAVLAHHPGLSDVLALPLAHHRVHAKALGPDAPPPPATPVFPVSPDPREALGTLLALEQQAADSRDAEAVSDPRDGGLLAAIGACEAVHVDLLMAALPSVNAPARHGQFTAGAGECPHGPVLRSTGHRAATPSRSAAFAHAESGAAPAADRCTVGERRSGAIAHVAGPGAMKVLTGSPDRETRAAADLIQREHAVIYGLAAGGGRLAAAAASAAAVGAVDGSFDAHRLRRDQLTEVLRQRGAAIPAAEPAYLLPPATDAIGTATFLADLEDGTSAAYDAALDDFVDPALRRLAVAAVRDGARFRTRLLLALGRPASEAAHVLPGRAG